MSVSATYRPPYCPKCPAASGSLRAADALLDLPLILPSPALLAAPGDVDAVERHRREADLRRDALDQITRRIDEHADERRPGHGFRDRPGACHVDVARAAGPEIEAEKVRARADRGARVLGRADAADLHLHGH